MTRNLFTSSKYNKILRHSFSKLSAEFDNSDKSLIEIHKSSYNNFLISANDGNASIKDVLNSIFPINDSYGYVSIEYIDYRLTEPLLSLDEAKIKSGTYGADLYITLRLILFTTDDTTGVRNIKAIKEQEVFLCNFPLMSDSGSFIVNGVERIVVCQIHKSPGVFFNRKVKDNKSLAYIATIIPYRGSRLEFNFEGKNSLSFRIDKKKKMPIQYLLRCLDLSNEEIVTKFYEPLELKYISNDIFEFEIDNINSLVGIVPTMNFRDKDGKILITKDIVLSRLVANSVKNIKKFYVNIEDLSGKMLYRKITIGDNVYDTPFVLTKTLIEEFVKSNIDEIVIINENLKTFSTAIANALIISQDVSYENALTSVMKNLRPGEPFVLKEAKKHFHGIFFEQTYYSLFAVGRYKLNTTLGLTIADNKLVLTNDDIIASIKKLIELKQLNSQTEDIDNLGNRRIRSVGEIVENQFRIGMTKVGKYIFEKLNSLILDTAVPSDFINAGPVIKAIREFFMLSELAQFMEQTNLLSELAHGRKISSLGTGGISRDRASSEVRDIHPTHYGRICPIETPDGQNVGLITSLASYATINKYGFIETPYRRVDNCKITNDIQYLDASTEMKYHIGQITKKGVKDNELIEDLIPTRYKGDFIMAEKNEISYVDVAPRQIISVIASLIPFLESNDTGRALMGCNMQRQAVPLLYTNAPVVGTDIESVVARESSAVIRAKSSGKVSMVDSEMILVKLDEKNKSSDSDIDIYHLKKFKRSNQSTCINQKPLVNIGDYVKKGDIIADGPATHMGDTALGKNVLVAFMPWNGYNYEDSVVISQRLVTKDVFTSLHIEEFEVAVRDTRLGVEEITRDIYGVNEQDLKYLDESGIIHVGVNVKAGDIMVGKITPKSETPITSEEKLLRAIFGDKISETRDSSLRVPPGVYGTVIDVKILTRRGNLKDYRALQIEREQIVKRTRQKNYEVDIINSFFSKEVDTLVDNVDIIIKGKKEPINKKDFTLFTLQQKFKINIADKDILRELLSFGNSYDVIIKKLEEKYAKDIEKIMDGDDLSNGVLKIVKVYLATKSRIQAGDKIAGRHGNKGVVSVTLPEEDMPFMEDGTPIDLLLSSISVPGRMNIGQVLETHLGFASYGIGKKIDKMIIENESVNHIRSFIEDVAIDDKFKKQIAKLSDEELMQVADTYRNGIYFATPVFDGASVEEIETLLEKCGYDKSGQITLYDGLTGEPFHRKVTVGYMYIMKLHHMVDGKIHARSIGPYSLVTQQPLGGKSHFGGQRFGEMECWALQAYGAAYTLQEMLTVKSDDVFGRKKMYESIINGETKFISGIPESFNVLCKELRSLAFDIEFGTN